MARVTDVPRNKLYPVMQQLNQLGIVETLLGEAQVFRPLPIDRFLRERLEALRDQVRDLDGSRDALVELFQPPVRGGEGSPANYRLFHGRANTVRQVRGALREARAHVHLLGTPASPRRMLASGEAELLRERLEEGLQAWVAVPLLPGNRPEAEELAKLLGPSLRLLPEATPECLVLSIDDGVVLQAQMQPDDGSAARGNDVTLVSESALLARSMAHYVRSVWDAAPPTPEGGPPGAGARAEPEAPSPGRP